MAASCAFFDKLPAELRNEIYDLVFSTDSNTANKKSIGGKKSTILKISKKSTGTKISVVDKPTEIELTKATPPSKALLLTCRQAHLEASQLHKTAFRTYWTTTHFFLLRHSSSTNMGGKNSLYHNSVIEALNQMPQRDLEQIRHLKLKRPPGNTEIRLWEYEMLDSRGGWKMDKTQWRWVGFNKDPEARAKYPRPRERHAYSEEDMRRRMDEVGVYARLTEQIDRLLVVT